MISLPNGIDKEFCVIKERKRIYISHNGDWSYELQELELVIFSLELKSQRN